MNRRPPHYRPQEFTDPDAPSLSKALRNGAIFLLLTGAICAFGWFYVVKGRDEGAQEDAARDRLTALGQELWAQGFSTSLEADERLSQVLTEDINRTRLMLEEAMTPKNPNAKQVKEKDFGLAGERFSLEPKVKPSILVTPVDGETFRMTYSWRGENVLDVTVLVDVDTLQPHLVEYRALKQIAAQREEEKRRNEEAKKAIEARAPRADAFPAPAEPAPTDAGSPPADTPPAAPAPEPVPADISPKAPTDSPSSNQSPS